MSYLRNLLVQPGPLDEHEIHDLERWLVVLGEDVEAFGTTPEDEARMAAIRTRIEAARESAPTP